MLEYRRLTAKQEIFCQQITMRKNTKKNNIYFIVKI